MDCRAASRIHRKMEDLVESNMGMVDGRREGDTFQVQDGVALVDYEVAPMVAKGFLD